ncbi:Myb-like DNA-binding domain containing protein [Trichomonas vaginalis G3]|uniref:Myb-like DNA-binding domain containing protein n=1 Tax=Trichomonas vaginalis (strain ATCC PRA-98 / G3) TaxID=412133 RepID=A2FZ92_TRIV3|nr:homeodomain-like family [Trichomonas vaginalis G3]EAX89781.1 Myb-like DNA-binding domain containing protein [Trichomonas vaginalis G3]KAI5493514.1 homeodomain-like family [Trichomonas vaginalis G3]|eukprot:XP_001302711.1 Myb-like DNA-binding domain containing protein [Trichomonas vaginalis G3]
MSLDIVKPDEPEKEPEKKDIAAKPPQQGPKKEVFKRPLTEEEKLIIVDYYHQWGKQWTKIAKRIGRSESTVRKWYETFQRTGTSSRPPGRETLISQPIIEQVISISAEDPSLTLDAISKKVGISRSSVHNILKQHNVK